MLLKKQKYSQKKQQYGRERFKNLSDDEKNKLLEYRKKYYKTGKKRFVIIIIRKYFHLEKLILPS